MNPESIQNARPAGIQTALGGQVKECSSARLPVSLGDRLAVLSAWALLAVLNALLRCQFGIRVAGACGRSMYEPAGGVAQSFSRDTAMALFMLFRTSGNEIARDAEGAVERTATWCPPASGRAARPFRGLSRGSWQSLPGEDAEQELFSVARSQPWVPRQRTGRPRRTRSARAE